MSFAIEIGIVCAVGLTLVVGSVLISKNRQSKSFAYTVEVIDGCEYLRFRTHYHDAITHKGNCKNHE